MMLNHLRCQAILALALLSYQQFHSAALFAQDAPAKLPDSEIADLARRLAGRARDVKCKPPNCKILVADFTLDSGLTSRLGLELADKLSDALASQGMFAIVSRSSFRELLQRDGLSEKSLATDEAMAWAGQELGGSAVIVGKIQGERDSLRLTARVLPTKKEKKKTKEEHLAFAYPDLAKNLTPVDPYSPSAGPETATVAATSDAVRAGVNGASAPVCLHCPLPSYTDPARAAKVQGSVTLDIMVSSTGKVTSARVVRGLPFGLTGSAINTVQDWKLKPAIKDDAPVAAMVIVEVSFRIF